MKNLLTEITERAQYHNQVNYNDLDKISNHIHCAWDWCECKDDYTGSKLYHDVIPMDFVKELIDSEDWDAAGLKEEYETLIG